MYNHKNQYRCPIVRSRVIKDIEDYLPFLMDTVDSCDGIDSSEFKDEFYNRYIIRFDKVKEKDVDNLRTEIAGQLFGLFYIDGNKIIKGEIVDCYLKDRDNIKFFKDFCFKLKFPHLGSKKFWIEQSNKGIELYPIRSLIKFLMFSEGEGINLSKREICYYLLNNLDFLSRKSINKQILGNIKKHRKKNITYRVKGVF